MKAAYEAILGQENIVNFFDKVAELSRRQAVGGSYIFVGPAGAGKKTLANLFLAKILCQSPGEIRPCLACSACEQIERHLSPDIFWLGLEADKKNISLDSVRGLLHSLGLSSFAGGYKAAVIDQADKLSLGAANALLKTLEEPTKNTILVLLTADIGALPLTIISRSQVFYLRPVKPDAVYDWLVARGLKRSQAKVLSHLSLGWPGLALKLASDDKKLNEHLQAAEFFLSAWRLGLSERLAKLNSLVASWPAAELLAVWQTANRDLLLNNLQQNDWARYQITDNEPLARPATKQLVAWHRLLAQARDYLNANVNERLVLENVIINL